MAEGVFALLDRCIDVAADGSVDPRALPAHGGVFLVTDADDRPILLAAGENLRRVVLHRFAAPESPSKRLNLAGVAARVHWRDTFSRFESAWAHWQAVRRLNTHPHTPPLYKGGPGGVNLQSAIRNPQSAIGSSATYSKGYRKQLAFGPAWFLRLDPREVHPRFMPVKDYDDARHFGPFAARSDAEAWARMLEDAFDLCRYHDILVQAPHGQACAYYEMGKCPAPCDGSVGMDVYRSMLDGAARFTLGDRGPRLAALRAAMQAAAKQLSFEKAAAIRQTMERAAAQAERPEHAHVDDLAAFRWLAVQRGGPASRSMKRIRVRPFFIDRGAVDAGEAVSLPELEGTVAAWVQRAQTIDGPAAEPDAAARSEGVWLTCKYLFQGDKAPGLFLRCDRMPNAGALCEQIRARFSKPEPEGGAS